MEGFAHRQVLMLFYRVLATGYRLKQSTLWLVFKKIQGRNQVFYEVFTGVTPQRGVNADQYTTFTTCERLALTRFNPVLRLYSPLICSADLRAGFYIIATLP